MKIESLDPMHILQLQQLWQLCTTSMYEQCLPVVVGQLLAALDGRPGKEHQAALAVDLHHLGVHAG